MNINMEKISSAIMDAVAVAVREKEDAEFNRKWKRIDTDNDKTLGELIAENHLEKFSDLSFDWFDDPLGVVLIPCEDYAIMARSRYEDRTLVAEYALYTARETFDNHDPVRNDLRYDATYTLDSVCSEKFSNIAKAVCHATAQIYMKGE